MACAHLSMHCSNKVVACTRRRLDRVRDDIKEKQKGLSAEDVYDRTTRRHISSNITPLKSRNNRKKTTWLLIVAQSCCW